MKFFALIIASVAAVKINPENDFSSYPIKALDGVADASFKSIGHLAKTTGYDAYVDSNNDSEREPKGMVETD